jgi:hypothetical protein
MTRYETANAFGLFTCSHTNRHKCPNLEKPERAIAQRNRDRGAAAA